MPTLDLEAARVAYLVDGDPGGEAIGAKLVESGVPTASICRLDVPGVENLLEFTAYRAAWAALLPECNPGVAGVRDLELPALDLDPATAPYSNGYESWARSLNLRHPSKVAVASWLIQHGEPELTADGEQALKSLHERLVDILGTGTGR
jgi:hypothetical protein